MRALKANFTAFLLNRRLHVTIYDTLPQMRKWGWCWREVASLIFEPAVNPCLWLMPQMERVLTPARQTYYNVREGKPSHTDSLTWDLIINFSDGSVPSLLEYFTVYSTGRSTVTPWNKRYTHYVCLSLPYCRAGLFSSHISVSFHLFTLLKRATCGVQVSVTTGCLHSRILYILRSWWLLTLNTFVFLSTEQRKKYSNSNFIMHETSQYHVEVRSALFLSLGKIKVVCYHFYCSCENTAKHIYSMVLWLRLEGKHISVKGT